MNNRALLFSGGMDSTALAWSIRPEVAITIDYGQVAAAGEIRAASAVCKALNLHHRIVSVDCRSLGSGDLAGTDSLALAPASEWWPYRNQLLITIAASIGLQEGAQILVMGAVSTDSLHVDGRAEFFEAMRIVLRMQEGGMDLEAPAIADTTISLCRRVSVPFEILAWAHSCHVSNYACGTCRGCHKHRESMQELGYGEY